MSGREFKRMVSERRGNGMGGGGVLRLQQKAGTREEAGKGGCIENGILHREKITNRARIRRDR